MSEKVVIGWNEHLDLPEWAIKDLRTKIDTGARTSSLDVDHIEFLPNKKVRFNVVLSKRKKTRRVMVTSKIARISKVKSSPIHKEKRVVVKTRIRIGNISKEIEINLVDRSNMVYRMLLGRSALKGDFWVDVSHSCILTKRRKRKKKKVGL